MSHEDLPTVKIESAVKIASAVNNDVYGADVEYEGETLLYAALTHDQVEAIQIASTTHEDAYDAEVLYECGEMAYVRIFKKNVLQSLLPLYKKVIAT